MTRKIENDTATDGATAHERSMSIAQRVRSAVGNPGLVILLLMIGAIGLLIEITSPGLGDFSVKLRVRWWIAPPRRDDVVGTRDEVLSRLKARLLEEGIDLPYPTTQVLLHDQTEVTDGDRRRQREGWPAGRGDVPRPRRVVAAAGDADALEHRPG